MKFTNKVKKAGKRFLSGVTAVLTAFSVATASLPVLQTMEAEAAGTIETSGGLLDANDVITKACSVLGKPYSIGNGSGKGVYSGNPYYGGTVTTYSAANVANLDCSGLVFWTLNQLGVTMSGLNLANGMKLPVDTIHWYSGSSGYSNATITVDGVTANAQLLRNQMSNKSDEYWLDDNGNVLPEGSVVVRQNSSYATNDHMWIYLGYGTEQEIIDKLKGLGISESTIKNNMVVEYTSSSQTTLARKYWRIESTSNSFSGSTFKKGSQVVSNINSTGKAGVVISNATNGKTSAYNGSIAYRITKQTVDIVIRKAVDGVWLNANDPYSDVKYYVKAKTASDSTWKYVTASYNSSAKNYTFTSTVSSGGTKFSMTAIGPTGKGWGGVSGKRVETQILDLPAFASNGDAVQYAVQEVVSGSNFSTVPKRVSAWRTETAGTDVSGSISGDSRDWVNIDSYKPAAFNNATSMATIDTFPTGMSARSAIKYTSGTMQFNFDFDDHEVGNLYVQKVYNGKYVDNDTDANKFSFTIKQGNNYVVAESYKLSSTSTKSYYRFKGFTTDSARATTFKMSHYDGSTTYNVAVTDVPLGTYSITESSPSSIDCIGYSRTRSTDPGNMFVTGYVDTTHVIGTPTGPGADTAAQETASLEITKAYKYGMIRYYNADAGYLYAYKYFNGEQYNTNNGGQVYFRIYDNTASRWIKGALNSSPDSDGKFYGYHMTGSANAESSATMFTVRTNASGSAYVRVRVPVTHSYTIYEYCNDSSYYPQYVRCGVGSSFANASSASTTNIYTNTTRSGGMRTNKLALTTTNRYGIGYFYNSSGHLYMHKYINDDIVSRTHYNSDGDKITYRVYSNDAGKYITASQNSDKSYKFTGYADNDADATVFEMYIPNTGYIWGADVALPLGSYKVEEIVGDTSVGLKKNAIAQAVGTSSDLAKPDWTSNSTGVVDDVTITPANRYGVVWFQNLTSIKINIRKSISYDMTTSSAVRVGTNQNNDEQLEFIKYRIKQGNKYITFKKISDNEYEYTGTTTNANWYAALISANGTDDSGNSLISVTGLPYGNINGAFTYEVEEIISGSGIDGMYITTHSLATSSSQNGNISWEPDTDNKISVQGSSSNTNLYVDFLNPTTGSLHIDKFYDGRIVSNSYNRDMGENVMSFKVYSETEGKWVTATSDGQSYTFSGFASEGTRMTMTPNEQGEFGVVVNGLPILKGDALEEYTVYEYGDEEAGTIQRANLFRTIPDSQKYYSYNNISNSTTTVNDVRTWDAAFNAEPGDGAIGSVSGITLVDSADPSSRVNYNINRVWVEFDNNETEVPANLEIYKYVDKKLIKDTDYSNASINSDFIYFTIEAKFGGSTLQVSVDNDYNYTGMSDTVQPICLAGADRKAVVKGLPATIGAYRVAYTVKEVVGSTMISNKANAIKQGSEAAGSSIGKLSWINQNPPTDTTGRITWDATDDANGDGVVVYRVAFNNTSNKSEVSISKYVEDINIGQSNVASKIASKANCPLTNEHLWFTVQDANNNYYHIRSVSTANGTRTYTIEPTPGALTATDAVGGSYFRLGDDGIIHIDTTNIPAQQLTVTEGVDANVDISSECQIPEDAEDRAQTQLIENGTAFEFVFTNKAPMPIPLKLQKYIKLADGSYGILNPNYTNSVRMKYITNTRFRLYAKPQDSASNQWFPVKLGNLRTSYTYSFKELSATAVTASSTNDDATEMVLAGDGAVTIYGLPAGYQYSVYEYNKTALPFTEIYTDGAFTDGSDHLTPITDLGRMTFDKNDVYTYNIYQPNPTVVDIAKYTVDLEGNRTLATKEDEPEINEKARFYLTTANGQYVSIEENKSGLYKYNGTKTSLDDSCYMRLADRTSAEKEYWNKVLYQVNGKILVLNLPEGDYTVHEILPEELKDKYLTETKTFNVSLTKDGVFGYARGFPGDNEDGATVRKEDADVSIELNNTLVSRDMTFVKIVKVGNTNLFASSGIPANIKNALRFYITDENGQYILASLDFDTGEWNYTGQSETLTADCYLTLDANDGFKINGLPFKETYTVHEEAVAGSNISNIMTTNKTVSFVSDKITYFDTENNVLVEDAAAVEMANTPKYGYAAIEKKAHDNQGETDDISGIVFNIHGTSDIGIDVNVDITTDAAGIAKTKTIPVGTYTVTEKSNPYVGYVIGLGEKTVQVTVANNSTAKAAKLLVNNYKPEIEIRKVDNKYKTTVTGATFAVYEDVNGNGTYESTVDTQLKDKSGNYVQITDPDGDGIYNFAGFTKFGKYLVKETAIADKEYKIDPNYYPVTFVEPALNNDGTPKDTSALKQYVYNRESDKAFVEEPDPCKITLTKRIRVEELDKRIWFEHGNPIFILELKNEEHGEIMRHSFEFTPEYVANHTFTENGEKYVEMSYTWEDIRAGKYTASEVQNVRYTLKEIINIEYGTYNRTKNVAELTAAPNQEPKATFYNVKNTYKDLTHTCIKVNHVHAE